jgi:RNA polymerase sigma-70 factor (sigma-E family)
MGADVETIRIEGGLLADLYVRHADEALRLSYLLTGDGALAEDLVQDAFVRVAGRLMHLRDPGGFHAYLRKTIVNLARSHHRHRAVERRYLERQKEAPPIELDDRSDRERLRQALMALPIGQRTAIVLRYFEDLSEAQTADLMGRHPGAVKSLVSRGMGTLRTTVGVDV